MCPERAKHRLAVTNLGEPEQILEAALRLPKRVTLNVEEQVARRGLRQEAEAALGLWLERLPDMLTAEPMMQLERRLVRSFAYVTAAIRGTSVSSAAAPSCASVVIPTPASRVIWSWRIPATRTR